MDEGFGTTSLNDATIRVGNHNQCGPHLQVGVAETHVDVTAEALIDTQQSSLSTVISRQSIDSLPLNGRNFTDFTLLTPGATTDGQGMVSFNGVAGNFNNYSVDGGNNNNAFFSQHIGRNTVPFQFSEDVIQEFQLPIRDLRRNSVRPEVVSSTRLPEAVRTNCTAMPTTFY